MLLMMLVLVPYGPVKAEQGKFLNRSLYVPVTFRVCEHLSEANLYIEDQRVGALPIERIFLFTYYPDLKRLLPKVTNLRVEGVRTDDNSPFIGRLALDPTAIYTSERLNWNMNGMLSRGWLNSSRFCLRFSKLSRVASSAGT